MRWLIGIFAVLVAIWLLRNHIATGIYTSGIWHGWL